MNRFSQTDILAELIDLGSELTAALRQELSYYRASVYKDETAARIREQIENLRMLADLIRDEILSDAFCDHDEMLAQGGQMAVPGECIFSMRTTRLISALTKRFIVLERRYASDREADSPRDLRDRVRYRRRDILGMCRHGSRHWSFFHTV